jgi:two-component system chemotaxis response regulator CheB
MVIVQHMPEKFTAAFAERLDSLPDRVKEAENGDRVVPGQALIAPGGATCCCNAAARSIGWRWRRPAGQPPQALGGRAVPLGGQGRGRNALGIIMTGMGDDGAAAC